MTAGRFTDCDLSNASALCMPWVKVNKQLRPPFSQEAAKMSLELAATAYDMRMDAWKEAGWHDISFQVDQTLLTGSAVNGDENRRFSGAITGYYQHLARARLSRQNPITQLRGALRQREDSDTGKSVVMIHRLPGGRYVVAIGFMGTGKRIHDWFSNFRLAREEGMHLGFLQLARKFEAACDRICFPETAKELGLERLTLSDIFQSCRRPDSPFYLWMAGHSQGGAVMQIVAFREIRKGLLRQRMIGYGFTSPSVVYQNPGDDLSGFPLYHIMNGDDAFPRVGAALHIGRRRVFAPDREMREICYRAAWPDPAFRSLLSLTRLIRDSRSGLICTLALLHALEDLPDSESAAVLTGILGRLMPERLLGALGGRLDELLRLLIRKTERGYFLSTGEEKLPDNLILQLRLRMERLIAQYGARPFVKALLLALALPHKLRGSDEKNGVASYQYIITERFGSLCHRLPGSVTDRRPGPTPGRRQTAGRFARFSAAIARRARHTSDASRRNT